MKAKLVLQVVLQLVLQLVLLLVLAAQPSRAQSCSSSRALSSQPFGFQAAASQGVNSSFAYLAFLLNVTGSGGSSQLQCSAVAASRNNSLIAMQQVQAAAWAVSSFRDRYSELLPGVTVGSLVLDTCQSAALTAQQLSNLESCQTTFGTAAARVAPGNTVSIIGIESLAEAAEALPLLRASGRPGVAFDLAAAGYDTSPYPQLARLAPSDADEAAALAELVRAVGARHAQLVIGSGSRFSSMAAQLQSSLAERSICAANVVQFSPLAAASVNSQPGVRPVALLLSVAEMRSFSQQMLALRPASGAFTWLLPSEQSRSLDEATAGRENFFAGSLALFQIANATGYSNFQEYFKALTPSTAGMAAVNPWLNAFWPRYFRCNLPGSSGSTFATTCNYADPAQNLQATPRFDASAARVIQAVDLSLHALDTARRDACGANSTGLCAAFLSSSSRLRTVYANMYNSSSVVPGVPQLTRDGGPRNFSLLVRSYRKLYPGHEWQTVGEFQSTGSLSLTSQPQAYGPDERNVSWATVCDSACSAACLPNASTTLSSSATSEASTPPPASPATPGSLRRQNWIYALMVCAGVGIVITLIFMVFILLVIRQLPPEFKNFSSLWAGQVLLFVILIGYITLFAWAPWPTREACGVIRFMVGFVYAGIFSLLLVKLLNLMNAFLPPEYQLLMFCLGVAVQVATGIEWLVLVPIRVTVTQAGSQCEYGFLNHLQSLVYCMLLILLCTILSVYAHAIDKNYREAIFIGCASGLSIPIWIAWSLVGSLNAGQDFKDASMAFGLFVNLTLVLLVIFLPKINQLRKLAAEEPEKNQEELYTTGSNQIFVVAPSAKSEGSVIVAAPYGSLHNGTQPHNGTHPHHQQQLPSGSKPATLTRDPNTKPKAYTDFDEEEQEQQEKEKEKHRTLGSSASAENSLSQQRRSQVNLGFL